MTTASNPWSPDTWQAKPNGQGIEYPDKPGLIAAVKQLATLPPLVTSAKTQSTERVAGAQAKLTWVGSDRTSGFWQAREIWLWMVATEAG